LFNQTHDVYDVSKVPKGTAWLPPPQSFLSGDKAMPFCNLTSSPHLRIRPQFFYKTLFRSNRSNGSPPASAPPKLAAANGFKGSSGS
jgi:hypothetical protein